MIMRGRAFKIRQVYAELRRAIGKELPAIELLQLATKLVDATRSAVIVDDGNCFALHPDGDRLPLDEAFADGGWRMMARDHGYTPEQFEDDPCLAARTKSTLDRLMKRAA
jgi:hypothetical protein